MDAWEKTVPGRGKSQSKTKMGTCPKSSKDNKEASGGRDMGSDGSQGEWEGKAGVSGGAVGREGSRWIIWDSVQNGSHLTKVNKSSN